MQIQKEKKKACEGEKEEKKMASSDNDFLCE